MNQGEVLHILTAPDAGGTIESRQQVKAIEGEGLEGDRFRDPTRPADQDHRRDTDVTLIEIENLEWFRESQGLPLEPEEFRRNIVTRGIQLNDLVGKQLRVGEVVMEGRRLCEPCAKLQKRLGRQILPAMVHRGGLNCRIVSGGEIRVGDAVEPMEDDKSA
ncbi:MAG: MOSC domain-containing protein [Phycisphaerales bacterium]|nr:MOSC domain-containing protein [Phycisphaerales bacterium]